MRAPSEKSLKQAVECLIRAGTTFDTEQLKLLYHTNLTVVMVDDEGQSTILDKSAVINMFQSRQENGDLPLNNWAEFSHLEATGDYGHVIVIRKVNLMGIEQKFVFSIELLWEENRWQITREVAVVQPPKERA